MRNVSGVRSSVWMLPLIVLRRDHGHYRHGQTHPPLAHAPPQVWEMYKKAEASFWTAEELDLAHDQKVSGGTGVASPYACAVDDVSKSRLPTMGSLCTGGTSRSRAGG
jgi:hypothetical protein